MKEWQFDLAVLKMCWQVINKYHGHTGDSYWGHDWCRLTRANKLRAVLTLYAAINGKLTKSAAWFTMNETRIVLNMATKYDLIKEQKDFDDLLQRCYVLWHDKNNPQAVKILTRHTP
jgi:hypothetical protein